MSSGGLTSNAKTASDDRGGPSGCALRSISEIPASASPRLKGLEEGVANLRGSGSLQKFGQTGPGKGTVLVGGSGQPRFSRGFPCRPVQASTGDACVFDRSQYQSVVQNVRYLFNLHRLPLQVAAAPSSAPLRVSPT